MTHKVQQNKPTIVEQAADWYQRLQDPDVPEDDVVNWQSWLSEDEIHMQAFEKIEEVMQLSSQADEIKWPDKDELSLDKYDVDITVTQWQQQQALTNTDNKTRFSWRDPIIFNHRPKWVVTGLGFAVIAMVTFSVFINQGKRGLSVNNDLNMALHETQAAEHRDVTLDDGSRITLGAKSLISVTYNTKQRRVLLERGEAFFNVAKDPQRPFIVVSGARSITAVGTAFNVTRHSDRVVVTVTEGTVAVVEKGETLPIDEPVNVSLEQDEIDAVTMLKAGQQFAYSNDAVTEVVITDTEVVTAWREGRLKYLGEKLRYVIADVNRYTDKPIHLGDDAAADILFTGTVFQDNIDTWLESIAEVFPIKINRMANGEVILLFKVSE